MAGPESQSEEQRIRRFLEALGQPATSRPPSPVASRKPQVSLPRLNPMRSPLPPLKTVPPPLPPPLPTAMVDPRPTPQRVFQPAPVLETGFEVRDIDFVATAEDLRPGVTNVAAQQSLSARLRSPDGLRDAIVLREIFGPPRSLQPFDIVERS